MPACRRPGSSCNACGLSSQTLFKTKSASAAKIILVASAPTQAELAEGYQLHGAGKILRYCLKAAELNINAMLCTYVIPCQAPEDKQDTPEFEDALELCKPGLNALLAKALKRGARVVVPIGQLAAHAVGVEGSIFKTRGSVYERSFGGQFAYVVPIVDPIYIMRGNFAEELTMITDLQKAARISSDGWSPPAEEFVLYPTIEFLESKLEELRKQDPKPLLAVDTEGWIGGWQKHWMTGFATSSTYAFCIPWKKQGGGLYWKTMEEQQRAQAVLKALLAEFPLMFQNAQFDATVFAHLGFECKNIQHDIMLAHHVFHPELPHNLGYISSIYADTPYWKDVVLTSEVHFNQLTDDIFRTYNMRDCVVLHQILPGLLEDLRAAGVEHIYNNIAVKLVRPTVKMQLNGIRLLKSRIPQWQAHVEEGHAAALKSLREFISAPETFSPSSPYHVRWMFFGSKPASFDKSIEELKSYDLPGTRKRRTTQAYQKLVAATETIQKLVPLERVSGKLNVTDTGKLSTDKQALNKMRLSAIREIERTEKLKRRTSAHALRLANLRRVVGTIERVLDWSRWQKLKSTYFDFKADDDGHIHPSYPIHRTRTGRLASKGPNFQNLPEAATSLFGPAPGSVWIKPDWSNIEMRVLSFASHDKVLQDQFAAGKKIHDENVKVLFGIDRRDPRFDVFKRAAKTYIFGRGYGGGLYGIFERVSMQVPEANLTFDSFQRADDNYRRAHSAYVAWSTQIMRDATKFRSACNAFGRRRIFIGDEASIKREALNTPIQGTAADIANVCLIQLQEWIDAHKTSAKLILQIHDSIAIECKRDEADRISKLMHDIMEQKFTVWGYNVSFPIEVDVCEKAWNEHVKYEDWVKGVKYVAHKGDLQYTEDWGLQEDDPDETK